MHLILLQQSKILDPKYFEERVTPEQERYDRSFKARIPKKMGNVVSTFKD